jgi:hypothetical protein
MMRRAPAATRRGRAAPAPLAELVDTLSLTGGRAAAVQSALLPAELVATPGWLRGFGEGYFQYLGTLPLLAATRTADGAHRLGPWPAPARLPLLRFAPPYLAASRGGHELRYPIAGGLMARGASGYIAFGQAPAGERARVWVEVLEFWPRLGLGPLYILTQVALHRLITVAYLRRVAAQPAAPLVG